MTKQGANSTKTTSTFDKSILFQDQTEFEMVDVPPYGAFKIRSLTRAEALSMSGEENVAKIEQLIISMGTVDPELSATDVKRWQEHAPTMALDPLTEAISKMSGLDEEAEKEAVHEFPEGPGD